MSFAIEDSSDELPTAPAFEYFWMDCTMFRGMLLTSHVCFYLWSSVISGG